MTDHHPSVTSLLQASDHLLKASHAVREAASDHQRGDKVAAVQHTYTALAHVEQAHKHFSNVAKHHIDMNVQE